ncbi:Sensory/regulatory protein RpfC [Stieleria neptunia]|uniref:histidine kinase n=1 Tax=Stieleria neptunia TaxID=2527979 RepID=A0A518I2R9_9BACT|nr:ATP-binding protein [Stieleria neptunia]QDV47403.1 Sensory/regulatory protein RpfC [Stieleria neptunia]
MQSAESTEYRYRTLRELPDVAGVHCWLVQDLQGEGRLVIRDLPTAMFKEGLRIRFQNEARLLSEIECDSYNSMVSYDIDDDRIRLVYRYRDGISLSRLIAQSAMSPQSTLRLACDLLQALIQIHRQGCVHRDWRPSHVILTPTGEAILSGYGPVWRANLAAGDSPIGIETVRYASPEMAGIIRHDIGPASDLYSLGLILYWALAGEPMCDATTVGDILLQHSTSDLDADRFPGDTPPQLVSMIERLTQKEPRERYQSAAAALADATAILNMIQDGDSATPVVIGRSDARSDLVDPAFVGRESQLQTLQENLTDVAAGSWRQALISCVSGMGKSRLNQEITRLATRHGFLVFQGESIHHAAAEPNAPWMQVVNQVAQFCVSHPDTRQRLRETMSDYREEVITAMPSLADVFGWTGSTLSGPDELGQGRVVAAFAALLTQLGSGDCPVMISLDDCQWMDDQSIRVLQRVARSDAPFQLLLLSARTDEGQTARVRDAAQLDHMLDLGPLDADSIRRLSESMAGVLPDEAIKVIQDFAEGSPFMAAAILRGMVESSVLVSDKERWVLDRERLENFQTTAEAGEVLAGRLENLPPKARHFLDAAAVIGSEFTLDAVVELSQIDLSESFELLADIRRHRMLWSKPDGSYAFAHDKIREAVLAHLTPDVKQRMHGRIGQYFAKTQPDRIYDLAYHFDAAGMHREALPHALNAASKARQEFSLGSARRQLEIAARAFHVTDSATRHQVEAMMSEVLMLQGEYNGAQQWLVAASKTATTEMDDAVVATRRGELAFKRGDKVQAVEFFESALTRLRQPVCRNRFQLFTNLLREITVQAVHTAVPLLVRSRTRSPDDTEQLRLRLYSNIARGYWYTRDKYYTLWAHLRGMNRGECYRPSAGLAHAYSEHAPAMTLLGWYRRGIDYAKRSLQIRKDLHDVWGQGQSRNFMSILHYSFSNYEQCIHEASQAVAILERTGDYWEVHIARYQFAASLYRQGNLREALDQTRINYRSAVRRSDFQGTGNIVEVWARAALGNIPLDVLQIELKRNVDDAQRICEVKLAYGVYHFYQHGYAEAVNAFTEAVQIAEDASVVNAYISPCYAWRATALRRLLETEPAKTDAMRRKKLRELQSACRQAVRLANRYTNELPHALRELAAVSAFQGRTRRALRHFRRSLRIADQQGARLEQIQTTLLHAELAKETGWAVDEALVREASEALQQLKTSVGSVDEDGSLSLVDRFDSLLEAGRRIAVGTEIDVIRDEIIAAASKLLRGDRVLLIQPATENGPATTIPPNTVYDPDIVKQTQTKGSAIICEYERSDLCDVRSRHSDPHHNYGTFLCCPVLVHGKIHSYLYIANSYMMGMFGDDELRIANYLSSAAGAAFEKADGFTQLQELNQTLERKVAQRTETLQLRNEEIERTADRLRATQVNLREAKDLAEHANRAKSEFLARMSHEIRTPITAVLGYTELMLRGIVTDPEEQRQHLETIHGNGSHLLHLLNDILDLSKIEADKIEVEQISCVPAKVIGEVIKSLQGKAAQKNITLGIDSGSQIPETITSDPTRLRQIVTNLIGNAIKFTDRGGVTVRLSTRLDETTGLPDQIVVAIRDSGIGMDADQLERIFDPFAQADTSTTRKYGGTGLGLSISKRLAESLGGGLEVESIPGVGSTFTIHIAADTRPGDRLLSDSEVIELATGRHEAQWQRVDLTGAKVLVVDDAETNRDLIHRLLTSAGAGVQSVADGQQAVDFFLDPNGTLKSHSIDLVLMDMQMPVLDGYSATQQLVGAGLKTPIVAMTANSMVGDDSKCRQVGCRDYLSKPIDLDALLEMVRSWCADSIVPHSRHSDPPQSTPAVDRSPPSQPPTSETMSPPPITDESHAPLLPSDWLRQFAIDLVAKVHFQMPAIKNAYDCADYDEVARKLHWIKGSGGTVGLNTLTDLAKSCEQAAKASDTDALTERLDAIESYVNLLVEECGEELPNPQASENAAPHLD